jgi:hypothetical protein
MAKVIQLLTLILMELKITNQYLSDMTGKRYKAGRRFDF